MQKGYEYVAVPLEEPTKEEQELPAYSKELPNNHATFMPANSATHEFQRGIWRKVLAIVLLLFLSCHFVFGLSFFIFNELDSSSLYDQYIWVESPDIDDLSLSLASNIHNQLICEPDIVWNGPSEVLIDPLGVSGLTFSIKGFSAQGSVIIRQDPFMKDYINVTNRIALSGEELQDDVRVKYDLIDDVYSVVIESPSFEGPHPTQKCVNIDTIITFPSHIQSFKSLLVDVPNSFVLVEGLGNIDFAYVSLKTSIGNIKSEDISATNAKLTSINGRIQGYYIITEELDARTINGDININVIANAWTEGIAATAKSINGQIELNAHGLTNKQHVDFKASSVNGGIISSLHDAFVGDFSASTLIGYTRIDGDDITYTRNTRNTKVGFKGNDDDSHHGKKGCRKQHNKKHCHKNYIKKADCYKKSHKHHNNRNNSHVTLETVTGFVELYFDN